MKMIKKILIIGWLLGLASVAGLAQSICTDIPSAPTRIPAGGVISDASILTLTAGNWLISTKTPSIVVGTIDATGLKSAANLYIQSGQQLNLSTIVVGSTLNIIVMPGGFLTFAQKVILSPNVTIYNYGNVNALGDFTLNGKFFNAIYSELDASKSNLLISGEGKMVNNGVVLLNDLKIESSMTPVICVGVNSCINTNTFSQNTVANSVQPNFASTTSFGNITITGMITDIRNGITYSSSIKVFLAKITFPANWGKATVVEGVTSPFCSKGLTELVDPNPASSQIICEGAVPNPIKYLPATGGDGVNYTYLWQSSDDAKTWEDVNKGNPDDYAPPALNLTTYIRRIVTSVLSDTSNVHTISILPAFNPKNNIISSGGAVYCDFGQVNVAGSDVYTLEGLGRNIVRYNWLKYNSKLKTWESLNINTMSYDASASALYRRTVASNGRCNVDTSAFAEVGSGNRFVVTNTYDNVEVPTCGMLRFALNAANELPDLNEITFKLPNSPNSILLEGGLTISSNVKIVGPGKELLAIDGNGKSNIFNFYSRQVTSARLEAVDTITTISGLTFKGANGGALNFNSAASSLVLKKCDFVSNTSSSGAGLNFTGVNLVIDTCTFNGNNIITNPQTGFVGNGAGANIQASGNVLMRNSLFLNNLGANNGGGVYLSGSFTDAKVLYSSFVKNSANNGGGMAVDLNTSGKVNVIFSTFSGNNSTIGGGIYSNSDFTLSNSSLSENSAKSTGGGVEVMTGTFSFIDNIIAGNISSVSNGRDLHLYKGTATSKGYNFIGVSNDMTGDVPTWDKTNDILGTATAPISSKLFPLDPVSYTYSPIIGSPVIGKGIVYSGLPSTDQLGNSTKGTPFCMGSVSIGPIYTPPFGFSTCSSSPKLNASVVPLGYKGTWATKSNISISNINDPLTNIKFSGDTTKADSANITWSLYSNSGIFATSTTIKVVRKATPAAPSVITPINACLNDTLKFTTTATAPATLLWYTSLTGKGSASIIPNTDTVNTKKYYVSQVLNGCESPKSTITVVTNALPSTPKPSTVSPICAGTNLSFTLPAISTTAIYSWLGPNKFSSGDQKPVITAASVSASGTYRVVAFEKATGCTSDTGKVAVTVNSLPVPPSAITGSPICQGDSGIYSVKLSTVTGLNYIWTYSGKNISLFPSVNSVKLKTIPNTTSQISDTLHVAAVLAVCTSSVSKIRVIVNPLPATPLIRSNSPICSGADLSFSTDPVKSATYAWVGVKGYVSTLQNPIIKAATVLDSGLYSLVVKDTLTKCSSIGGKIRVVVNPTPNSPSAIQGVNAICLGDSTIYSVTPVTGLTYSWTYPNKTAKIAGTGNTIKLKPIQSGTLEVIAATSTCNSIAASKSIIVNPLPATPLIRSNSPICSGADLRFSTDLVKSATYAWSGVKGYVSTLQNPIIKAATVLDSGLYSLVVKDTLTKCSSIAGKIKVVVNPKPATPTIIGTCVSSTPPVTLGSDYSKDITKTSTWFRDKTSVGKGGSFIVRQTGGIYRVLVSDTLTKCASDTSLGVDPFITTPKILHGAIPFCTGDSLKVSSSSPAGNSWVFNKKPIQVTSTGAQMLKIGSAGMLVLQVSSGNCPGKDSLVIEVTPLPAQPAIAGPDSMCLGQTVLLSTATAKGFQWIKDNLALSNATGSTLIVSDTGTYRVKITSNDCSNTSTPKVIRFKKMPVPPRLNTNGSQTLCEGNALSLSIQNYISTQDQWYFAGKNINNPKASLSATTAGNYKVLRTITGGCTAVSDSVSVTVSPCAVLTYAGKDTSICTNSYKLAAIGSANYQTAWRVLSGKATFVDSTSATTTASNLAPGLNKLVWLIKSSGKIVGSDTVEITNNSVSKANAGIDIKTCVDSTILNGSVPLAGETGRWFNYDESNLLILNPAQYNTPIKRLQPFNGFQSSNTFIWRISKENCISRDTVEVFRNSVVITVKDTVKGIAGKLIDVPVTLNDKYTLGDKLKVSGKWPKGGAIDTAYVVGDTLLRFKTNNKNYLRNFSINYILSNQCPSGRDTGVVVLNSVNSVPKNNVDQSIKLTSGSDTLVSFGSILYDANPNIDSLHLVSNTNRGVLKLSFNADSSKILFSISYKTNPTFIGTETFQFVVGDKNENGIRSFATSAILVSVAEAPTNVAKAGPDQILCADTTTLDARLAPVGMNGKWSVIKGKASFANLANAKTKVSALASDTNKLVWTLSLSQNGVAISKDTVNIINNKNVANAGLDRKVFVGTINLIGNTGTTPAWRKIPNTTIISRDSSFNASLSVGLNTFEYSLSGSNCTSRDSVRITYVIKDTARAGNDIYACVDTSILKATKPKTANRGKWTFVGKNSGALTIANDTLFNSKISGISAGNGVLLWTVTSLIDSTTRSVDTLKIFNAKVTVTITKPTSAPDIALTQKTISLAETVVSAFPAASTWYRNDTLQTIVPSTFTKNVTVFKVKVANKYCGASDSLTVTLVDTTKAYAGPNQEIYVDSTLSGALKPANEYKGTWSKETTSPIVIVDKNVYDTKFKNIPFGTSKLVWTLVSPNAITTRDTLVIVRKKLTVEAVVTQPVCTQANGTISIKIKELSNYLDTFVGDTLKGATTKGLSPKSYKVRIFRNGKPVKDTSFVLKAMNTYKLTLSSKDTSFCTGLSLTIKGKITPSIFATYKWSGSKISSADSVIVSDSGKYVLTTTASGCVLKDSVKVRLFPSPKAFAGNDTLTCQSTAKLKAGSLKQGEKGTWSKLFGTSILSATNIPNPTVTFLSKYDSTKGKETNRFVWSVSDQNQRCTTHDTVDVYYAVVLISVQDDTSGIAGQEIALKVTQNDKYALGDKLILTTIDTKIGAGQPILAYDVQDLTVVFKTNPRYYVKEPYRFGYIISNACQARDTGYVVLNKTTNDPPTAKTFTKSTESGSVYTFVLNFSEVDKNPNISKAKVERSLHGLPTATFSPDSSQLTIKVDYSAVPEFSGLDTLLLRVCDVDELGKDSCVFETFIIDIVSKNKNDLGLTFYNGLSKNEDGKNEIFFIENVEKYPENNIKILNRWGDVVYSADKYNNKDVAFDGGTLPDGTYYYFFDPGNGLKIIKGFILLKR